ncbi:hypothetical protein L5G28_00635 [Gordonia sp. HY285]|uniref:DUF7144 domain-containing protein n=1 Tax=Gordonia liuliyuniae TaxID=2911517 RepID=A0ABS9IPN8_9ACTN|nr:hypothetical protein [Gordonia liuliyuniae]MCF8587500.1 hypothetical protein [Gordonia liuliyuniae]MCF8608672.1 hypothetical protein [Gordonia liuliyuniae]
MTHTTDDREANPVRQGVSGTTTFAAAILLFVAGLLAFFQGLSAVLEDDLFVVGPEYTYALDTTSWGWIHLIVGALGVLIAIGLMSGATWARVSAIVIAGVSIVANFLWLPYYPWWSILVIALDLVVIWAVTTWRTD